jgi:hypothetical protein
VQYFDSSTPPALNIIADHVTFLFPLAPAPGEVVAVRDVNYARNRWSQPVVGYLPNGHALELPTGEIVTHDCFLHPRWKHVEWIYTESGWRVQRLVAFAFGHPCVIPRDVSNAAAVDLAYGEEALSIGLSTLQPTVLTLPPRPAAALLAALPSARIADEEDIRCGYAGLPVSQIFNPSDGIAAVIVTPATRATLAPGVDGSVDGRGMAWSTCRNAPFDPVQPPLQLLLSRTSVL